MADGSMPRTKLDESTQGALLLAERALQDLPPLASSVDGQSGDVKLRLYDYVKANDGRLTNRRRPEIASVTPETLDRGLVPDTSSQSRQEREVIRRAKEAVDHDLEVRIAIARRLGSDVRSRVESIPRYVGLNADHTVVNRELYLFFLDPLVDVQTSRIVYTVGENAPSIGATLIRCALFEVLVDGSLAMRAVTNNLASTALTSVGLMEPAPFRTDTGYPRVYTLRYPYRYAWGLLAVGQTQEGHLRGVKLNGTEDLQPIGARMVPSQNDILTTYAASALQSTNKLAYGAAAA
jgi:hypothetical protein